VTDAVQHALTGIGIDDLRIDLVDGCIHLHGSAPSYEAKRLATERARCAAPRACIANELRIAQMSVASEVVGTQDIVPGDAAINDAQVAMALRDYVRRAANVPAGRVTVDFRDGVASLAGSVRSRAQAEALEDLVRWHDHVTDVDNSLRVALPGSARSARRVS
jgi:osmotically-inducible protein OsmY